MKPSLLALIFVPFLLLACESARAQVRDISQPDFVANPPANALILDVRSAEEFTAGHVPKAKLIPHDELAERITELEAAKDAPIVVYCESGRRAGMAGDVLLEAGLARLFEVLVRVRRRGCQKNYLLETYGVRKHGESGNTCRGWWEVGSSVR